MTHGGLSLYVPTTKEHQPEALAEYLVQRVHPTEAESENLTDQIEAIAIECASSGTPVVVICGGT